MAKATDPQQAGSQGAKASAKAEKQAERERKRNATNPADMGRFRQIAFAYKRTYEYDKALPFLLIGCFLVPLAVGIVLGIVFGMALTFVLTGVMVGVLLAMIMLVQRTKAATYKRYHGQPGSAEVALSMLPKKWVSSPAIAANRQLDAVHRTVGPGGIVLIGEGEPGRLKNLLNSETRKHEKIAYKAPVTTMTMGDKAGQVPLEKLAGKIRKLPKVLTPAQITEVKSRLTALDSVRQQMPVPKGPMPTSPRQVRGAKQAMRGR